MKNGWVWFFAFLTAGGTGIAVVQLATDPDRDLPSFLYGVIVGGVAAACIAALVTNRGRAQPPGTPQLRTHAAAVDEALVVVADLKAQQAHAAAQQRAASAQATEARRANASVDAARFEGDASQYGVHHQALFDRIRSAETEVARLKRLTPQQWEKEQARLARR